MPFVAPRLIALARALMVAGLVAGCQLPPAGGTVADGDVTANAVAGDAIEVMALDAPQDVPQDALLGAAPTDIALPEATAAEVPAAAPAVETEDADPAVAEAEAAPEAAPAPPKSERQLVCEKRGGTWSGTGKGSLRICVFPTRDGGKQCNRESQCEGLCLARSGTCSPVRPLLGCNEILQDNGARVTQCIE